jgi:hypothetical protein
MGKILKVFVTRRIAFAFVYEGKQAVKEPYKNRTLDGNSFFVLL